MSEISNNRPDDREGMKVFMILMRHKIFIIVTVALMTAASVVISLILPEWYRAEASIVPPNSSSGLTDNAFGGISSALKDFGLTSLGGSGGEGYSLLVLLESRSLADSLIRIFDLRKVYELEDTLMRDARKMLRDNMDITLEREGNYTVSILDKDPVRAAKMVNTFVRLANNLSMQMFRKETRDNLQYAEKRLEAIDSTIAAISDTLIKFSQKHEIYSPEDQAQAISGAISEIKAQEINYEIQYNFYRNKYGEEDPNTQMLKELLDQAKKKTREITGQPGFAGNFALNEASEVMVQYMRLLAELETYTKVKALLTPSVEKTRIDMHNQPRYLYVLDSATVPEKKYLPKRSLIVAGTFAGSAVISVLMVLAMHGFRVFKENYQEYKQNV
jgi:capsule polysaccharide export protein KpsE/RkpR